MRVKGILFNPTETFREVESEGIGEAFKQLLVLTLVLAVGTGLVAYLTMAAMETMLKSAIPSEMPIGAEVQGLSGFLIISAIVGTYIFTVLGVIIGALVIHIFVYLFGGRQGVEQTLKTAMYAVTPTLLLGWLPLINVIAGLWSLVLFVLGIRELQKISTGAAILAVILPIILCAVIASVLTWVWVASMSSISMPSGMMPGY